MQHVLSSVYEPTSEEFVIGGSRRSRARRGDRNAPDVESALDVNEDALEAESESDEPDADASADASNAIDLEDVNDDTDPDDVDPAIEVEDVNTSIDLDDVHDEIETDDPEDETDNATDEVQIEREDAADDVAGEAKDVSEEPKPTKVKKQHWRRAPKIERPKRTRPKSSQPQSSRPKSSRPKSSRPSTRPRRIGVPTVALALALVVVGVFAGLQQQHLSAARDNNVRLQALNASQVQQIARLSGDADEMDAKLATLTTKAKTLSGSLAKARTQAESSKTEAESSKTEADKATQAVRKLTSQANTLLANAMQELDKLVAAVKGADLPVASGAATKAQTLLDDAASVVAQITSAK